MKFPEYTSPPQPDARPLSTWTAAMLVGTVLATALVLGLVIERFARHHEITRARAALAQMGWQLRDALDRGMAERFDEIVALAASRPLRATADADALRDALQSLRDQAPPYAWIGVTDADGKVLAAAGGLPEGRDVSAQPWFKGALAGPRVGDVRPAAPLAQQPPAQAEPRRLVDLAAPVVVDGKVRGVLGAHLGWEWARQLARELPSPQAAHGGVEVFITRADGEVLAGPAGAPETKLDLGVLRAAAAADAGWFSPEPHVAAVVATQGRDRYPGLGWTVVVRQPTQLALAHHAELRLQLALATLLVAAAVGLLAPGLAHRLASPLLQLMRWLALAQPQALRLQGPAYREARELAEAIGGLRERERRQAAELRVLNADLEARVARHAAELADGRQRLQAAAAELAQARQAAEAAEAARSGFLAHMGHEIRAPLNAVVGRAYLLEQTALDAAQKESVAQIHLAGRTLLGVVNNVLDLARIEAREVALESRTFDLRALLKDLRALFAAQAHAKGLALVIEPAPATLELLVGDDTRLRQILANLLSNALKFTEAGQVALRVGSESAGPDRVRLHCTVQDTGVGIPLEAQRRLFLPFAQAEAGGARPHGGAGLGLAIVRHLAELMGGSVAVHSEPGQGSQFFVTVELGLGLRPGEEDSELQVALVSARPERRETLMAMCRSMGWRAGLLPPAQAAARLQAPAGSAALPDVLLVDAQAQDTPASSAQALLAEALAVHRINGKPVVVLVSESGDAAAAAACDVSLQPHGRLPWPADTSALFGAVTQAMASHWAGIDGAALARTPLPAGSRALPGVRVLVADDSRISREVAMRILEQQGAVVSTAGDGVQALQWLREHCDACDVVLMDVQMPLMDGLEATRRLRTDLGLTRLPVLALTAGALVTERERARAAGMDDFLSKPLEPQALVRGVRWHVERAQGQPLPYEALPGAGAALPAEAGVPRARPVRGATDTVADALAMAAGREAGEEVDCDAASVRARERLPQAHGAAQ